MNAPVNPLEAHRAAMNDVLGRQKAAHLRDGPPSVEKRIDWLNRCIDLLIGHQAEIAKAVNEDFGSRSPEATALTDVAGSIGPLKSARPLRRSWACSAAKAMVQYQPKGVVGVISPWNFPVNLTFAPLAGVFAAGNRAMIKPSEFTPATSDLLKAMFAKAFAEEEVAVFVGGPEVGQAFSGLAFDHLVFTGATSVARHVMRAAAENLVPVTLELGGKSPVILSAWPPDYVFAPQEEVETFVAEAKAAVGRYFPTLKDNPDYTALVAQRHYDRVKGYVDDARAKGARIVEINPAGEDLSQQEHRKIAPTLILDPTDDMKVMQEEIFGPVLPVKTYKSVDEAVDYVNAHDRPLALYWFGTDEAEKDRVLARTTSGGVTVNDVIFHVAQEELPFGGVGPAGMGAYHGHDGFLEFSHKKAVFQQLKKDIAPMLGLRPPYGEAIRKYLAGQIKK
ncbi:Aldehyde dehydrogenase [Aphelenchoides fujianensis]|nr:Aldehyde dehydrogenase [Aphelenchoides fujianensis]